MTSAFDFETVDGESAWAQVSSDEGRVRLVVSIATETSTCSSTLSIATDGDVDVLLDPATATRLADALTAAARGGG
jgi:hypothetical protein